MSLTEFPEPGASSFNYRPLFVMVIVVGVQGIYIIRIWKLGRYFHRILPWIVSLTFLVALGNGIFSVYAAYIISDFKALPGVEGSICVIHTIPPFSDFIIALSMCYYLRKSRQAYGLSKASDKLLGIMRLGVISGLATSICSLLILITYLAWPNTLIFFGIDLILPKLYINSLLAMYVLPVLDRYWKANIPRLNSRKARTNDSSDESKAVRALTYNNSGTEVAHISISMRSSVSLDHAK
ncbi:hypothetical protein EV421DRAFT_1903954 [Armillaria borealis]|uniref:DUF6534 domain-containing protein n=1 Tax=Armillaria borealis TaxID=47425 RepID=A0AA39JIE5_9AGAR|nr:hypothetical protein EV421DRAFT_1903954 [Armillaria borealis]